MSDYEIKHSKETDIQLLLAQRETRIHKVNATAKVIAFNLFFQPVHEVHDVLEKTTDDAIEAFSIEFADGYGSAIGDTVARNLFQRTVLATYEKAVEDVVEQNVAEETQEVMWAAIERHIDITLLVADMDSMASLPVWCVPTYEQRIASGAMSPLTTVEQLKAFEADRNYPQFYVQLQLRNAQPAMLASNLATLTELKESAMRKFQLTKDKFYLDCCEAYAEAILTLNTTQTEEAA